MPKNDIIAPWERQPKEGSGAYEAFAIYRDLGGERSLRKTAQKLGKNCTTITEWSSRWDWVERCRAWDNFVTRQAREKAIKDRKEMMTRQTNIALLMQQKAVQALEKLDPEHMDRNDIIRFVAEGTKLERLNRGEPTEIMEGRNEISVAYDPYEGLTTDDLKKLLSISNENKG